MPRFLVRSVLFELRSSPYATMSDERGAVRSFCDSRSKFFRGCQYTQSSYLQEVLCITEDIARGGKALALFCLRAEGQLTTGKERRLSRWEHEAVLEAVQARLDRNPDKMRVRRQTVEHPFGTIKSWMGSTHFQMKTLKNVSTEMALHVLAYNMKRVMRILGVGGLIEAIRA